MIVKEAIRKLRSDLDDEQIINTNFDDYQMADFLSRGLERVNKELNIYMKREYLHTREKLLYYDLPSDYIKYRGMLDCRKDVLIPYNSFDSGVRLFHYSAKAQSDWYPAFSIDENLKHIKFNFIEEPVVSVTYTITSYTSEYILISDATYAFAYFFDEVKFVRLTETSSGNENIYQILEVETVGTTRKLWIAAADIENSGLTGTWDTLKLVECVFEYYAQVPEMKEFDDSEWISCTYNTTTVTTNKTLADLTAGWGIVWNGLTRHIDTIGASSFAVNKVFDEFDTITQEEFKIVYLNSEYPIPAEYMQSVLDFAMYFAHLRLNMQDADNKYQLAMAKIQGEKQKEKEEDLKKLNDRNDLFQFLNR
jgi:hypothetical protein